VQPYQITVCPLLPGSRGTSVNVLASRTCGVPKPGILSRCLTWTFALSPRMLEAAYWVCFAAKGRIRGW